MWNVKLWIFFLLVFPSVSSFGFVIPSVPKIVSLESHRKISSSCFLRLPYYDINKSNGMKKESQLNLFGLFGGDDDSKNKNDLELIRFSNLEKSGNNSNKNQPTYYYKSLVEFLKEWSLFLEGNKSGMMTTPIQVSFLTNIQHEEGQDEVESSFGVKLSFQRVKSTYDDDEEEDEKKEEKVTSEGGVLIVITQTQNNSEISIVAKRCDIEEGTLIKEMSEETIVQNLKDAMTAWKKEQTTKR